MMVGHEHAHAESFRFRDALDARDAVVHGDEHVGPAPFVGEAHDLGRQAVAVLEAVRHQELDGGSEGTQCAHPDRARGGAVGVVVRDDEQFLA
ncbi:hypothetical protein D3C83_52850 [compost metagenome]